MNVEYVNSNFLDYSKMKTQTLEVTVVISQAPENLSSAPRVWESPYHKKHYRAQCRSWEMENKWAAWSLFPGHRGAMYSSNRMLVLGTKEPRQRAASPKAAWVLGIAPSQLGWQRCISLAQLWAPRGQGPFSFLCPQCPLRGLAHWGSQRPFAAGAALPSPTLRVEKRDLFGKLRVPSH